MTPGRGGPGKGNFEGQPEGSIPSRSTSCATYPPGYVEEDAAVPLDRHLTPLETATHGRGDDVEPDGEVGPGR
jgi:hypothetical protein